MKILALVTNVCTHGGIARYNHNFFDAMTTNQTIDEVIVITRDTVTTPIFYQSNVKISSATPSKIRYIFRTFLAFLKNRPFQLIFCGHIHMLPLAIILSKIAKAPIWLQIHGIEAWKKPNKLMRRLMQQVDFVTSVSRYTRDQFCLQYGYDFHRVKVLPNTIEDVFYPDVKSIPLLNQYHLQNKRILLSVSRLLSSEQYKGIDKVITILPNLLKKFPTLCYVIVGNGDDTDRLKYLAKTQQVENAVVFLEDIADQNLPDIFRLADVYVMPSCGEGFGIVFLEAIYSGLPVIAGNQDGSVDALREGQLGHLVDPHDSEALISSITAALLGEWKGDLDKATVFNKKNFNQHCQLLLAFLIQ